MTQNSTKNLISALSEKTGLNVVLTELLFKRGFNTEEKLVEFLEPKLSALCSPFIFEGMSQSVDIINKYVGRGKILIFGDYDCDGIGASAMLKMALEEHGADVSVFIPTRIEDGYGLSEGSLHRAIDLHKPSLIITVDCGIGSVEEVETAKSLGVEIIVTDHHEPREVILTVDATESQEGKVQRNSKIPVAMLMGRSPTQGAWMVRSFPLKFQETQSTCSGGV